MVVAFLQVRAAGTLYSIMAVQLLTLSLGLCRTRDLGVDAYAEREADMQSWRRLEFENDPFRRRPVPIERSPVRRPVPSPMPPARQLRCKRCNGLRSSRYHSQHYRDPLTYPSVGICSRRRTCCAAAKTTIQMYGCQQIIELPANELGWSSNTSCDKP